MSGPIGSLSLWVRKPANMKTGKASRIVDFGGKIRTMIDGSVGPVYSSPIVPDSAVRIAITAAERFGEVSMAPWKRMGKNVAEKRQPGLSISAVRRFTERKESLQYPPPQGFLTV